MKKFVSFVICSLITFSSLAIQVHSYYVGAISEDCHVLFVVISNDDGSYIASGYAKVGICDGIPNPSPTHNHIHYENNLEDTLSTMNFVDYLLNNPADELELANYLATHYSAYFPKQKSGTFIGSTDIIHKNPSIAISPNPSMGSFEILIQGYSQEEYITVSAISLSGKVVYEKSVHISNGHAIERIDLKELSSGTYIITLRGRDLNEQRQIELIK